MDIVVVGSGYVGFPLALGLSEKYNVSVVDVCKEKVDLINSGQSVLREQAIVDYIAKNGLSVKAYTDGMEVYKSANIVFIALPTDWDEAIHSFNTSRIDDVLADIFAVNRKTVVVIKSTVPIGYTEKKCIEYHTDKILFSPEFSREGCAWYDLKNPSRLIFGIRQSDSNNSELCASLCMLVYDAIVDKKCPMLVMTNSEAESVKLFANSYLAMRVAFFNELDSFALEHNLSAERIIDGVVADARIGRQYCRPSFGYGGYCLPKDTRQLAAQMNEEYSPLLRSLNQSNDARLDFIGRYIQARRTGTVGIYGLEMKPGSDNLRNSRALALAKWLVDRDEDVVVYVKGSDLDGTSLNVKVVKTMDEFLDVASFIVTDKDVTSDLFGSVPYFVFDGTFTEDCGDNWG